MIIIGSGINNFLSIKLNSPAILSPVLLVISILVLAYYLPKNNYIIFGNNVTRWFYLPYLYFLIIGGIVGVTYGKMDRVLDAYRYYLPSLLVFWGGIYAFYHLLKSGSWFSVFLLLRWILAINCGVILFNYFSGSDFFILANDNDANISGFLLNPNDAGFAANLLLSIEIFFLKTKQSKLVWLTIPAVLVVILIGFSRTAMATAIGIFILNLTDMSGQQRRQKKRLLFFLIAMGVAGLYLFNNLIIELIEARSYKWQNVIRLIGGEINVQTTGYRSNLIRIGFNKVMEKPILGHGLHTFVKFEGLGSGVHNQFLLMWGDAGVFSVFFFLIYHLALWVKARKVESSFKILIRSIISAILLYSLTNHNMYGNKTYMLVLALVTMLITSHYYVRNIWRVRG